MRVLAIVHQLDAGLGTFADAIREVGAALETSLPAGATALAHSTRCLQAYRVGESTWGIQFHAEVTARDFEAWLDDYRTDPDAVDLDVDQLRSRTRDAIAAWNQLGRELFARFL